MKPHRTSFWLLYYIVGHSYMWSLSFISALHRIKKHVQPKDKLVSSAHLSYTEGSSIIITMSKSRSRSSVQCNTYVCLICKSKQNQMKQLLAVLCKSALPLLNASWKELAYMESVLKNVFAQIKIMEAFGWVKSNSIKQHSTSHIWDWCNAVIICGT